MSPPHLALSLYFAGAFFLTAGLKIRTVPESHPVAPLERGLAHGDVAPGLPHLDPNDAMANAAVLMAAIADVSVPRSANDGEGCRSPARSFSLLVDGEFSTVRFSARAVCQLDRLKRISAAQPGFGARGLGEVAAFVLGRRLGDAVDVTRVVVPPFRFTGDTVTFVEADLGPLLPSEQFVGTYHTHPGADLDEGVLSDVDLRFTQAGRVDFHGQVGALAQGPDVDWLFDIVEPRDGDWNVYAHDRRKLEELALACERGRSCPLDALRVTGSPFYLLTRYYEEQSD